MPRKAPPRVTSEGKGLRFISEAFATLRRENPAWTAQHFGVHATYAIPKNAIGAPVGLFTPPQLAAEIGFAACCNEMGAVGVRGDRLITCHLLTPSRIAVHPEIIKRMGWPAHTSAVIEKLADEVNESNKRIVGVAGRLMTEPAFLEAVDKLRAAWEDLPQAGRPDFPFFRPAASASVDTDSEAASPGVTDFFERLTAFLDRWGLLSVGDWHLPVPQGPMLPSALPVGAPAEPRHGIRIVLPLQYPLQGDDELLRKIAALQREAAVAADIPAGVAAVKHTDQHAQMFRLIHLETVLRSRFPAKPPRGFIGHLENAAAAELDISIESVKRLRRWIKQCRSGRRSAIPRLRD